MKRIASSLCLAVLGSLAALSCGPPPVMAKPPNIPVVPVTFEANLITAQECEYRGPVGDIYEADRAGANLVLAFTYANASTSQSTSSNIPLLSGQRQWSADGMRGKAVKCPEDTIGRVLALNPGLEPK